MEPLGSIQKVLYWFFMEPFGFIHYHLFCSVRIKYFILLTNIKTLKCIYECMSMITKFKIWGLKMYIFISFYVVNQYHTKSAVSVSPPKISMINVIVSYYNSLINNHLITTTKCCRIM